MGRKYGVDPTLMMAIAEFETGHGSSYSARVRNNIAGIMDGKRHRV
jgi:flagellum-specific peptidoglycan hydrolase FlgJ